MRAPFAAKAHVDATERVRAPVQALLADAQQLAEGRSAYRVPWQGAKADAHVQLRGGTEALARCEGHAINVQPRTSKAFVGAQRLQWSTSFGDSAFGKPTEDHQSLCRTRRAGPAAASTPVTTTEHLALPLSTSETALDTTEAVADELQA